MRAGIVDMRKARYIICVRNQTQSPRANRSQTARRMGSHDVQLRLLLLILKERLATFMEQRLLPEKPTGLQLVNKFPAFYGTRS